MISVHALYGEKQKVIWKVTGLKTPDFVESKTRLYAFKID